MASIMEGALWTLSDAAAERMAENGLIKRCEGAHTVSNELREAGFVDPIYHRACDAPDWFGYSTMHQAITSAEAHAELQKEIQEIDKELKVPSSKIPEFTFMELILDPTMTPDPVTGAGKITEVKHDEGTDLSGA